MGEASARPTKAAIVIAQRIIGDVTQSGLQPGASLPPERIMLETYETGRGTLREALRLLEFQGVIVLKPGPRGGPVLLRPDASHLAGSLVLLMQLSSAPLRMTLEARSELEPIVSRLAATRMSPAQRVELAECVDRMEAEIDGAGFSGWNRRFHDLIGRSSGNPLFDYLLDSLLDILENTPLAADYPAQRRHAVLAAHRRILAAMTDGDPDSAEREMRRHVAAYDAFAQGNHPQVLEEVLAWDRS